MPIGTPKMIPIKLKGPALVAAGFKTSFLSCRASYVAHTVENWIPAAAGIIAYWTDVMFSVEPVPPGLASNIVIDPGSITPLATDIHFAFSSSSADECADRLTLAMTNHLLTIKGATAGITPGKTPAPFLNPWTALV